MRQIILKVNKTFLNTLKKIVMILLKWQSVFIVKLLPFICILSLGAEGRDTNVAELEQRLTPYFQMVHRSAIKKTAKQVRSIPPSFNDLQKIALNWEYLSTGFKKIYLDAAAIPSDFLSYKSRGFGIEVFYTKKGTDAVDTTDNWGIDTLNWRERITIKNGIPDYVDEVAWALDSAWYMEVVRFGFPMPQPYYSTGSSNYKVQITAQESGVYGLTYPTGPAQGSTGFMSLVTIRNSWAGWDYNEIIDYGTHPEKGIRVTCAHELFHAIQYRMARTEKEDIYIDDFPVSWLEATSGMMEELAFGDINDFTQYSKSYFNNPALFNVFGNSIGNEVYANVLMCLFLDNEITKASGINFFKSIFFDNMSAVFSFDTLLNRAAVLSGTSWTELLGLFHASSFFTASRSSKNRFIGDAQLLPSWSYTVGEGRTGTILSKTVSPWSVQFVSYVNDGKEGDTLRFSGKTSGIDKKNFSLHIITRNVNNSKDSIITLNLAGKDTFGVEIVDWNVLSEAIIVISNGNRNYNLSVKIGFGQGPEFVNHNIFNNPVVYNRDCLEKTFLLNGKQMCNDIGFRNDLRYHKFGSGYRITQLNNKKSNIKVQMSH